jgi:hypothetical protein
MEQSFNTKGQQHQQPAFNHDQTDPKQQPYSLEDDLGNAWEQITNEQLQNQVTNVDANPERSDESLFDKPQDHAEELDKTSDEAEDILDEEFNDDENFAEDSPKEIERNVSKMNPL